MCQKEGAGDGRVPMGEEDEEEQHSARSNGCPGRQGLRSADLVGWEM